jgi:hypothetical protein
MDVIETPLDMPPLPLEIWEYILRCSPAIDWLRSVWRDQDHASRKKAEAEAELDAVRAAASESMDVFDTFCDLGNLDEDAEGRRGHGARFSTEIHTRGCKWFPRLLASSE